MTFAAVGGGAWQWATLGDLFEIQQGKALSPAARRGLSPRPFLRTANVLWGDLALDTVDEMDFSPEEERRYRLAPDDLLVCEGGEIGRTALWGGEIENCLYQNHLHRLRASHPDIDPAFVMYWMQYAFLISRFYVGRGNTTTIANLSKSRLSAFEIPQPPLAEQRAIARVLRSVQRAGEQTEQVIGAAEVLLASLRHSLLESQTETEPLGAGWSDTTLGAVAEIRYGLGQPPTPMVNGTPMIRATNIKRGRIVSNGLLYVDADAVPPSRDARLRAGDVIVVRSGAYTGDSALVGSEWAGALAGYDLIVRPKRDVSPRYCAQLLLSPSVQNYFHSQRARSAQPHLNKEQLGATPIRLPTWDEQEGVADILGSLETKIDAERARRHALRVLFRSLLRDLMTARIDLTHLAAKSA